MSSHYISAADILELVARSEIGGGGVHGYNRECVLNPAYIIELSGQHISYVVLPHDFSFTRAVTGLFDNVQADKIPAGEVKIVTKSFGEYNSKDIGKIKQIVQKYGLLSETQSGSWYNMLLRKVNADDILVGEPVYPANTYSKTVDVSGRPSSGSAETQINLAIGDVLSAVDEIDTIVNKWAKESTSITAENNR